MPQDAAWRTSSRDGIVIPDYLNPNNSQDNFTDLWTNAPFGNTDALQKLLSTCRALQTGEDDNLHLSDNDLRFAWRDLNEEPPPAPVTDLVFWDGTRIRSGDGENAQAGTYKTATAAAGNFISPGGVLIPTANPSVIIFSTAAAYADPVAAVGLFVVDNANTGIEAGVLVRGTAATDHLRAEYRTTSEEVALVDRTSSSDTDDFAATYSNAADIGSEQMYFAVGLKYSSDKTTVAMNGIIQEAETAASANAQALTGHAVGVRMVTAGKRLGFVGFRAWVPNS